MNKEEMISFFHRATQARLDLTAAKEAVETFSASTPEPKQPTVVLDVDEWLAYKDAVVERNRCLERLKLLENEALQTWANVERVAVNTLPYKVWFRHGEWALGIAFSNWGGSRYYLDIRPWSDDLPSLDRTYHGD